MFRHVVMFRWRENADERAIEVALEQLAMLPERIEEVRSFQVGTDAGLAEGNYDVVVVAEFEDADAYQRYAAHPAHVGLVRDHLRPLLADRAAVQHHLSTNEGERWATA